MRRIVLLAVVLLGTLLAGGARAATPPQPVYLPTVLSAPLQIAFMGNTERDAPPQVYTAYADGSRLTQLTTTDGAWPTWSPDGRRIAFLSIREHKRLLYQMDADGNNQRRLSDQEMPGSSLLSWSPDGAFIAYRRNFRVVYDLGILRLSDQTFSGIGGFITSRPAWSPDSQRLVYNYDGYDIRTSRIDGSDPITVTQMFDDPPGGPSWSPDGTQLAFTAGTKLYLINIDGTGKRLLTSEPEAHGLSNTAWSPDGRLIAYTIYRTDGSSTIHIINADGTGKYELETGFYSIDGISWRPR